MSAIENRRLKSLQWLIERKDHAGDGCLIWPFSRNFEGYGQAGMGKGVVRKAHRVMCRLAHGDPPTPKHHAAHSCGNGNGGCVHPGHLIWKTQSGNEQDKKRHGTARGGRGTRTRLTAAQIAHIRASKGEIRADVLGRMYGLTRAGIRYWQDSEHQPKAPGSSISSIRRRAKAA